MKATDALKLGIDMGKMIATSYLEDMTDDELMKRPCDGGNHIKWQLGHLISSEHQMIEAIAPGTSPSLPEGFAEKYKKETASSDDPGDFHSKEELMSLFEGQRAATLTALENSTDEDLAKPGPEAMQAFAPTVAAIFSMQGSHWEMHAGQWAIIRRQLGRPPLF